MGTLQEERRDTDLEGELRLFNSQEYYKMGEIEVLGRGDELLGGVVYVRGLDKPWHWTVDDYHKMVDAGILRQDERTELIEGEIIKLAPIGPEHRAAMSRLTRLLIKLEESFGDHYNVLPESPIRLSNDAEPQPDVAVVYGTQADYDHRHPSPSDVRLIVEVSNSSVRRDRTKKYKIYAQMGIPEYWIVNLIGDVVEVYREPSGSGFGHRTVSDRQSSISPLFAPNVSIRVVDILPTQVPIKE